MLGRRLAGTTGIRSITTCPGDLGAVNSHDRHRHLRIGQDLGGLVGLKRPARAMRGASG
jgi:hypothetical protein